MITRRRIICSTLSALLIASCSFVGPDTHQRVVRIRALADVSFRSRNPRWAEEARGLIEAASDYYEREFDIRLLTQSVSAWPESERIPSTPNLLARMQKEFAGQSASQGYDLLVVFTAEGVTRILTAGRPRVDRIGNCTEGLGSYMVVPITKVFQYRGPNAEPEFDVIALIHEMGHIFGAEHVNDRDSVMHEEFGFRTEFDAKNRAIIQKNRSCPFAK
ncbi:MAG TPA: M12 family metallo-peptidase [Candidatus Binatia bacterium]|nr:M12 family metallo-peptidase [Candidatus Binatia bacterium]